MIASQLPSSLRISLRTKMAFRMNFVFLIFSLPIKIAVTWLLWDFIVGSEFHLMGMSKAQILLFVSFTSFLQFLYNTHETLLKMEQELIEGGAVVGFTLPIDYHVKEIFEGWGNFILYFSTGVFTLSVMIFVTSIPVSLSFYKITLLIFLILINTVLQYLLVSAFAALSVLVGKVGGFSSAVMNALLFLGGGVLPLALFPPIARDILIYNPMSSMIDFPATVLVSEKLIPSEIIFRLVIQLGWIILLFFVNRGIWHISRDRFSAPGE